MGYPKACLVRKEDAFVKNRIDLCFLNPKVSAVLSAIVFHIFNQILYDSSLFFRKFCYIYNNSVIRGVAVTNYKTIWKIYYWYDIMMSKVNLNLTKEHSRLVYALYFFDRVCNE